MTDDFGFSGESPKASVLLPAVKGSAEVVHSDIVAYREQLIKDYHGGTTTLVERLRSRGHKDSETLVLALIDEVIRETDNLLGNQLVAAENGDLRDASVISYKRAEVLEKALKAVQAKQKLERQGGLDVDSAAMATVFRFFMGKVKHVFEVMGVDDEMSDIFFRKLAEAMEEWKRELKVMFEDAKGS